MNDFPDQAEIAPFYFDDRALLSLHEIPRAPIWFRLRPSRLTRKVIQVLEKLVHWLERTESHLLQTSQPVPSDEAIRLHLGCGPKRLPGYINVDATATPATDVVMDILALDLPSNCVAEIYSSHMIEHLDWPDIDRALREWYRVLEPGGVMTIRCPNFIYVLEEFLRADYETRWRSHIRRIFGIVERGPWMAHRYGFSARRLQDVLHMHGFTVLRCEPVPNRGGDIPDHDLFCLARKPHVSEARK